jgi:hypothetical protein
MHHSIGMPCLQSPTAMVRMLDTSRGLYGPRYSELLLFIGVPRLFCGNSYHWCMRVIIYERPTTDHIHRIRHMVEASTPRWTFEGGMREATREALVLL